MQKTCLNCGKQFTTKHKNQKYCSNKCQLECQRQHQAKVLIERTCPICGKIFYVERKSNTKKTCSPQCKNKLISLSEQTTMNSESGMGQRKQSSIRMTQSNPMKSSQNIEKMLLMKELNGTLHQWKGNRGGNGQYTDPQIMLWKALGNSWILEYPVKTHCHKLNQSRYPTSYKVDLGCPEKKLAVEVDGNSHRSKKNIALDMKKTLCLNQLGWKVLRFANKEIMTNLQDVLQKIQNCMI